MAHRCLTPAYKISSYETRGFDLWAWGVKLSPGIDGARNQKTASRCETLGGTAAVTSLKTCITSISMTARRSTRFSYCGGPEVTKMSGQLNCDSYKLCLFGSRLGC